MKKRKERKKRNQHWLVEKRYARCDAKRDTFFPSLFLLATYTHRCRGFTISSTFFGRVVAYVDQRLGSVGPLRSLSLGVAAFAGQGSDANTRISFSGEAYDAVAPAVGTRNCVVVRIRIVGRRRGRERVRASRERVFKSDKDRGRERD